MVAKVGSSRADRRERIRGRRGRLAALALAFALAVAAATSAPAPAQEPPEEDPVTAAGCDRLATFDPDHFGPVSHRVNNRFLPLAPGTQRVFEGRSNATGQLLEHRVTFTVTGLIKVVDGVKAAVVWDVDQSAGEVTEAELAFFAQDRSGTVWNVGEYPEEYPQGLFIGAPSTWITGVGDAEPGIHMPARPEVGQPEYLQGSVPDIEFLDCATIFETGASLCSPIGCFDDVLVTHERSPLDGTNGIQVKSHAPGVGIVEISAINDPEAETLELVAFNRLTPVELREANHQARILDQRGIQCDEIYGETAPMIGPDDGDFGPYACGAPPPEQDPEVIVDSAPAFTPSPPAGGVAGTSAGSAATPPAPAFRAGVDHPVLPLGRLRRSVLAGHVRGAAVRVVRAVRAGTVRLEGVDAVAVDVRRTRAGRLVERSTEYYGQRADGAVLLLGRRVSAIRRGRVTGHPGQWIGGRDGARAGVVLPAQPATGQRFVRWQAPGRGRDPASRGDDGRAFRADAGRFGGCVQTRSRGSGGSGERGHAYCPGAGLVRVEVAGGVLRLERLSRRR